MSANLENPAVAIGLEYAIGLENAIPIPKKRSSKECSNYWALVLTSHASKVMLKSFKLGFSGT